MKVVNVAHYVDDEELVNRVRPAHREYLSRLFAEGKLLLAGPYLDKSGATIVYEAESIEAAHVLAKEDPFNLEGVFVRYELKEWNLVFVNPTILEKA